VIGDERVTPASDEVVMSKFILTVEVGAEQLDEVAEALSEAADVFRGRLTRQDFAQARDPRFLVRLRRRTLRKQGRLA